MKIRIYSACHNSRVIKMTLQKLAITISLSLSASLLSDVVSANPDINGAQIVNGQVSFSNPASNTLQINNSNAAIIQWQDFSINAGEVTHFQQTGVNSTVLNQVTGGNVSNIFGSLTSNGQVFLINPAGIVFGQNSIVNTAGFIASTLNLSNQDFLEGKLNFQGVDAGDILNQGFITAGANGDIALIAPNIVNEGIISVEQGDVILAAGEKVTLASLDASAVGFEVQSTETSVTNLGSVTSNGGAIGMFAATLKHEGHIEANALSLDENGNVILVAKNNLEITETATVSANGENGGRVLVQNENGTTLVAGTIEANGENGDGGVVDVLGEQVGLIDSATISADGKTGGGEIHIGGNYQGNGPLQNASGTYVGRHVSLSANATESGNGGEVIVWADGATRVYGSISASGGELFGDGGFVETSGKAYLDVAGILIDVAATDGINGEWLLDPTDISITTAANSGTVASPLPIYTASSNTSNILVTDLINALNTNANVTISTAGAGGSLGDILIDTNIDFSLGNTSTLTLSANNNITLSTNGSISVSGNSNLSLVFDAFNDIQIDGAITATGGTSVVNVSLTADSDSDSVGIMSFTTPVNTNGGSVVLKSAGDMTFDFNTNINSGTGLIDLVTTNGGINFQSSASFASSLLSANTITVDSAGVLLLENNGTAASFVSNNNDISIVANDISLFGTINAGTANLSISSTPGIDMSLGAAGFGLNLDATEISLLNAGAVFFGQTGIGAVYINATVDSTVPLTIEGSNIYFNHTVGSGISSSGDVSLIAAGSIIDNASATALIDIIAPNIDLVSAFGIGDPDPIEIQLNITPGQLSFNNAAADVNIINAAVSPSDVMRVTGDNTGIGGSVIIQNDQGITDVTGTGVTSNVGLLELSALQINVNALLDNNNFAAPVAMKLLGDEIEINANLFSTSGGILLSNLNLGGIINFDTTSNATGDLDFAQAEINFINAPSVDFGDVFNTSDMIFSAPVNFAALNVAFNAGADIQFSQGIGNTAITTTANVKLDAGGQVLGQPTAVEDIIAAQLDFTSGAGFGDVIGDAIEVNVGLLQGTDTGGSIYIDSSGALTTGIINASGSSPVWIEADGDLVLATINANGGNVLLDTTSATNGTGGGIFDDTVATNNIDGANLLDMFSETGVGTLANPLVVLNTSADVSADIASPGDIFIDNVGSNSGSFSIGSLTTSAGEVFVRNLNSLQTTDINTLISATGLVTVESNSTINVNNNVVSTDSSNVNLLVVGGAGDINVNSQVQSLTGLVNINTVNGSINIGSTGNINADTADLAANNGSILFNAGGFISAATINLDASVSIDDGLSINAIGGGSIVTLLNAQSAGNIVLDGAANNAVLVNVSSTAGNISYSDVDDVLLGGVHATDNGTDTGNVVGDVTINSGGSVIDGNGLAANISANNAIVNAVTGIGEADQIETRIGTSLSFANSSDGTVDFYELSTGTIQFWGVNNSTNTSTTDFTRLVSQFGSIDVPVGQTLSAPNTDLVLDVVDPAQTLFINGAVSVTNAANEINFLAPTLNLTSTGSVTATGTTNILSVLLKVDDLNIAAGGTVNAGLGDLAIENLSDGNTISLGGVSGDLSLTTADLAAFTSGRLGIGSNGGFGTGGILVEGAINFGATDTRLASVGDIAFNQAADGITSTANVELNTEGVILNLTNSGNDVVASGLNLAANNGIGSVNALTIQVTGLSVLNQNSGDVNVSNTGSLSLAGSANFGGSLTIKTDGLLTLSSAVGLTGGSGMVASNNLTLEGVGGLVIDSVASATSIDLLSQNGININDAVTASGFLKIDGDTDGNAIGDLVFDNLSGGTLRITANNMGLHGSNVYLYASSGALNVASNNAMNLVAENDLTIIGGELANSDAYLSSRGPTNIDVGGNLLLSGGGAPNARAAIFDETGANTNNLNLNVGGTATLTGGLGDTSGAIISVANLAMNVVGNLTLTGGDGNNSPAVINSSSGVMAVHTLAALTLTDGLGTGAGARIISNAGFGFLDLKYATCTGCDDTHVKFLSEPIVNTASGEVVYNQNTLFGTEPLISSSAALLQNLEGALPEGGGERLQEFLAGGHRPPRRPPADQDEEQDQDSAKEPERPARVMICR